MAIDKTISNRVLTEQEAKNLHDSLKESERRELWADRILTKNEVSCLKNSLSDPSEKQGRSLSILTKEEINEIKSNAESGKPVRGFWRRLLAGDLDDRNNIEIQVEPNKGAPRKIGLSDPNSPEPEFPV